MSTVAHDNGCAAIFYIGTCSDILHELPFYMTPECSALIHGATLLSLYCTNEFSVLI